MNALFESLRLEVIDINGVVYPMADLLGIDSTNLSDEYSQQAAMYGYIGTLCAGAESDYNSVKTQREAVYADVEMKVRHGIAMQPEVKSTEGLVKSLVVTDSEYLDIMELENRALGAWKKLRALTDALKQRGEMLVSLGAQLRAEMDMTNMAMYSTKDRLLQLRMDGQ